MVKMKVPSIRDIRKHACWGDYRKPVDQAGEAGRWYIFIRVWGEEEMEGGVKRNVKGELQGCQTPAILPLLSEIEAEDVHGLRRSTQMGAFDELAQQVKETIKSGTITLLSSSITFNKYEFVMPSKEVVEIYGLEMMGKNG